MKTTPAYRMISLLAVTLAGFQASAHRAVAAQTAIPDDLKHSIAEATERAEKKTIALLGDKKLEKKAVDLAVVGTVVAGADKRTNDLIKDGATLASLDLFRSGIDAMKKGLHAYLSALFTQRAEIIANAGIDLRKGAKDSLPVRLTRAERMSKGSGARSKEAQVYLALKDWIDTESKAVPSLIALQISKTAEKAGTDAGTTIYAKLKKGELGGKAPDVGTIARDSAKRAEDANKLDLPTNKEFTQQLVSVREDAHAVVATRISLAAIYTAARSFQVEKGTYPKSTQDLQAAGVSPEELKDAWGHEISYVSDGAHFVAKSLGADGKVGGTGAAADISIDENKQLK